MRSTCLLCRAFGELQPFRDVSGVISQVMLTCTHTSAREHTSEAVAVTADEAQYAMSKSLPVAIADPDEYVAIFIAGDTICNALCPLLLPCFTEGSVQACLLLQTSG